MEVQEKRNKKSKLAYEAAEALFCFKTCYEYLGERSQAVGGAGCVGDDVVLLGIVLLLVHAHDKHLSISRRRRDNDLDKRRPAGFSIIQVLRGEINNAS